MSMVIQYINLLRGFLKCAGRFSRLLPVIAGFAMAGVTLAAHAESRFTLPYAGGNFGGAGVKKPGGYEDAESWNAYGGFYLWRDLSAELWLADFAKFKLSGMDNSYSDSAGLGAALAYRLDLGKLFALRPSAGLFYSQTEITFQGYDIGEDSGSNLMFGLTGLFIYKDHVLITIDSHWFYDVSGSDISTFSIGAGYQF